MFTDSINISAVIPAKPKQVYQLWMTNKEPVLFTESKTSIGSAQNGAFTAEGICLSGKTIELEPYRRIVQVWRSCGLALKNTDSRLEVLLEEVDGGTRLTLSQTGIPRGRGKYYRQSWIDHYLEPLRVFFSSKEQAVV